MEYKDYYKILGLNKNASQDEIKKAYRKLARQYHPDRNPGNKEAEEKFKLVNEANEVLGNPENRKKYDELGSNWNRFSQSGQPGGGFDWEAFRKSQGQRGFEGNMHDFFGGGGGGGFSDFFEAFFGGGRRTQQKQGNHYESEFQMTLEEAYTGTSRIIQVHDEKLRITTKPGAYDGQILRIRGKGGLGANGGTRGDLYVSIKVKDHPIFRRKGENLYMQKEIDLFTAILGGDVIIPTLGGDIRIKIGAGTQNDKTIRIRGKGMPVYDRGGVFGDLYVEIKVRIPEELSREEKRLFEQLKNLSSGTKVKSDS